jgi:hypothetical protein
MRFNPPGCAVRGRRLPPYAAMLLLLGACAGGLQYKRLADTAPQTPPVISAQSR